MSRYVALETPSFRADIAKLEAWDPARIEEIADALEAAALLLRRFPEIGHPIQIRGEWSLTRRSWAVGETGYVLHYRLEHDKKRIVLLRFRHEAQRPLKR